MTSAMQNKKARSWVFTFNNYTENDVELIRGFIEGNCKWGIFGKEIAPTTGTPHLQGAFTLNNPKAWNGMMKLVNFSYLSPMNGSPKQNVDYCSKSGEVWEHGERPMQGKRSDCNLVRDMVKNKCSMQEIADVCTTVGQLNFAEKLINIFGEKRNWETEVFWFYGASGAGKSRYAREQAPHAWWSGQNLKWWDGYVNQEDVIIDDFRGDFCTLHYLLRITDRYECMVEIKGGTRQLVARRIFITSPYHPEKVYKNSDENLNQLARRLKYRVFWFDIDDPNIPKEERWEGVRNRR